MKDLQDARDPNAPCTLVKCALICLGLIPVERIEQGLDQNSFDDSLQFCLNEFCQVGDGKNARMEIIITSLLPQGSGMGTSSILGGCVLAAVGHCVGIEHASSLRSHHHNVSNAQLSAESDSDIIDAVSALEQILSTGGGFQDQVNGLIGGFKTVTCKKNQLPIQLSIERLEVAPAFQKTLENSLVLAFTGKTRLAKNILQNVLRRWAQRTPEVVETVKSLVEGAKQARESLERGDLQSLGECLDAYYSQKKHMAGENSGVEPEAVSRILNDLKQEKVICGASLCGAGGGGFLIMLAAPGVEKARVRSMVEKSSQTRKHFGSNSTDYVEDCDVFSFHECHISNEGLTTTILSPINGASADYFDVSWHRPNEPDGPE